MAEMLLGWTPGYNCPGVTVGGGGKLVDDWVADIPRPLVAELDEDVE